MVVTSLKWTHYAELVQKYHTELVGWPESLDFNPEKLTASSLNSVKNLIDKGECYWKKLGDFDYETLINRFRSEGKLPEFRSRKRRKGKASAPQPISAETVESDNEEL